MFVYSFLLWWEINAEFPIIDFFRILFLVFVNRCVWYGVLPVEEATKIHSNVLKWKKKGGSSPANSPASTAKKTKKSLTSSKKKLLDDVAVDAGMQVGGDEGVGTSAL